MHLYEEAGGIALDVSESGAWNDTAARPALGAELLRRAFGKLAGNRAFAQPLVRGMLPSGGSADGSFVHTAGYRGAGASNEILVLMAANFTWCVPGNPAAPPGPVKGFSVAFSTDANSTMPLAMDPLSGKALAVSSGTRRGEWIVAVPTFKRGAVVALCTGGAQACPDYAVP